MQLETMQFFTFQNYAFKQTIHPQKLPESNCTVEKIEKSDGFEQYED